MIRTFPVMFALLVGMALSGCVGADAEIAEQPSPLVATPDSEHAGHHHHHDYSDVVVEASLEPACVTPGETMTVTVATAPRTGVLYLAHYSDDRNGAKEPLGAGYGGNGGGYADDAGHFEESWTVSDDAPPGPGRLRVVTVADDGDDHIEFTVADPDQGSC